MLFIPNMHGEAELERRGLRGICSRLLKRLEKAASGIQLGSADTLYVSIGPNCRADRKLPDFEPPAYINCKLLKDGRVAVGPVGFYLYSKDGVATAHFDSNGHPKVYVNTVDATLDEAISHVFERFERRAAA